MKKKAALLLAVLLSVCILFPFAPAGAAAFNIDFATTTKSLELVNLDTGTVVFRKNADEKRYPASTTKVMTFIVVSEHVKDPDATKLTVSKEVLDRLLGTGSSMSRIKAGDVLTVTQLLNCMLIPSGNDAALILADYIGKGNVDAFVDLMNQKAKELGCTGTHFTNPHGLQDENHYTTAADLAKITMYAMSLPHFTEITSKISYALKPVGGPEAGQQRTLFTTNLMINQTSGGNYYYKYARGIKTGHTDESGYCLVSSATADGYSYLCVALGAPSVDANGHAIKTRAEMIDSRELYRWAFRNLELKSIVNKQSPIGEVKLNYAWNKDTLLLTAGKEYKAILPANVSPSSIIVKKNLPKTVDAPVKKGHVIGTATLSYANQELTTIDLVASESVERSQLLHTADLAKKILTAPWFLIIVGTILFLLIVYILLALVYNRKKKHLRKVKKYRRM